MRSGVGKLTVHIPWRNNDIMQVALPEAILNHDEDDKRWTCSPFESCLPNKYSAIGIGPGIGTGQETSEALHRMLEAMAGTSIPMVLDADAFAAFTETGDIFNEEVADKFRRYVLTPGGIDDGMTMYNNFRGRDPQIDALLKSNGLK